MPTVEELKKQFQSSSQTTNTSNVNAAAQKAGFTSSQAANGQSAPKPSNTQTNQAAANAGFVSSNASGGSSKKKNNTNNTVPKSLGDQILEKAKANEDQRKADFKAKQDAFDEEVARRQVATGQGIGASGNLQYTNTREGYRIANAAERIGLHAGDVRKEATRRAELENQARNDIISERSQNTVSAGQRNSDGSRITSASGSRPKEPTQAEINARVKQNLQNDSSGVNSNVADYYLNPTTPTQLQGSQQDPVGLSEAGNKASELILGSSVVGGPNADGNPYSPGSVDYYKWQLEESKRRKEANANNLQDFKVEKPAIVPEEYYNPFQPVTDKQGNVIDYTLAPGYTGKFSKTYHEAKDINAETGKPWGTEGYGYKYEPTDKDKLIFYPTAQTSKLTSDEQSRLGWEAISSLNARGYKGNITKDVIDQEISNLLNGKYAVTLENGQQGFALPTVQTDEEKSKETNTNYALFKANQIVSGVVDENGNVREKPFVTAFALSDYDSKLLVDAGNNPEDVKSVQGVNQSIIDYYAQVAQQRRISQKQYVDEIRNAEAEAKDLGYEFVPTGRDEKNWITSYEFKPIPGQRQYQYVDVYKDPTKPWDKSPDNYHREKVLIPNPAIDDFEKFRENYKNKSGDIPGLSQFSEFGQGMKTQAEGYGEVVGYTPSEPTALNTLLSIRQYEGKYSKLPGETEAQFRIRVRKLEAEANKNKPPSKPVEYDERGRVKTATPIIVAPIPGSPAWQTQQVLGAIADNPFRFGGEAFTEAGVAIATGEIGNAGGRAIKYVRTNKFEFTPPKIERPSYGTNPKGIELETSQSSKFIENINTVKRLYREGGGLRHGGLSSVFDNTLGSLKITPPKVRVTSKVPTKQGVSTEISEPSTGGVQGSQTEVDLTNVDVPSYAEPVNSTIDDAFKPVKEEPPARPPKGRGRNRHTTEADKAFENINSKSGEGKNEELRNVRNLGQGTTGTERGKEFGLRQQISEKLQNVAGSPMERLKRIGINKYNAAGFTEQPSGTTTYGGKIPKVDKPRPLNEDRFRAEDLNRQFESEKGIKPFQIEPPEPTKENIFEKIERVSHNKLKQSRLPKNKKNKETVRQIDAGLALDTGKGSGVSYGQIQILEEKPSQGAPIKPKVKKKDEGLIILDTHTLEEEARHEKTRQQQRDFYTNNTPKGRRRYKGEDTELVFLKTPQDGVTTRGKTEERTVPLFMEEIVNVPPWNTETNKINKPGDKSPGRNKQEDKGITTMINIPKNVPNPGVHIPKVTDFQITTPFTDVTTIQTPAELIVPRQTGRTTGRETTTTPKEIDLFRTLPIPTLGTPGFGIGHGGQERSGPVGLKKYAVHNLLAPEFSINENDTLFSNAQVESVFGVARVNKPAKSKEPSFDDLLWNTGKGKKRKKGGLGLF